MLAYAYLRCKGAAGVDGQTFADIEAYGERRWLEELAKELTANQDPSLYDPNAIRPYFNPPQAGPLALFGPYNETSASGNTAKARDTPATFTGPDGTQYVIWAGSSKAAVGSGTPVAPSLYLTKVAAAPGQPAFLQIVAQNTQVMSLAGANKLQQSTRRNWQFASKPVRRAIGRSQTRQFLVERACFGAPTTSYLFGHRA